MSRKYSKCQKLAKARLPPPSPSTQQISALDAVILLPLMKGDVKRRMSYSPWERKNCPGHVLPCVGEDLEGIFVNTLLGGIVERMTKYLLSWFGVWTTNEQRRVPREGC